MKYFKYILLLTHIFLSTIGFAQKGIADSLKKLLPLTKDSMKVNALIGIGYWYGNITNTGNNRDSAFLYLDQAYKESIRIGYSRGTADVLFAKSAAETGRHHYSAAERYVRQSIPYYEKNKDTPGIRCAYNVHGYLLYQQGNFDEAIKTYQVFLSLFQKPNTNDERTQISRVLEVMGVMYRLKGDLEKGFEVAQKWLAQSQQRNDSLGMAFPLTIIGDLYESMGDPAIALEYYYASAALGGNIDVY